MTAFGVDIFDISHQTTPQTSGVLYSSLDDVETSSEKGGSRRYCLAQITMLPTNGMIYFLISRLEF